MRIVLAYSGGLDTSVALKWLQERYGAEVIAFCADLGQPEDFDQIREKALRTGAVKAIVEDLREEYLSDFVFPALQAGALYERRYTMAAPLGRPLIAKYLVETAHRENAAAIAHGATGKGNDQVRFYTSVTALDPRLNVIAPAVEWELKSRDDEIAYAQRHNIPVTATRSGPFSMDGSIWGTSTECGIIDDYRARAPEEAYQITDSPLHAPDEPQEITVGFDRGRPVSLDGEQLPPVDLVLRLNAAGRRHGVGRIDMVENSLLGIKSRALYESPAGVMLHFAHRELEDLTVERETLHFKQQVALKYAELTYYGLWFSPLRRALDGFVATTQETVTGEVTLRLFKGSVSVLSRDSKYAQYDYRLTASDSSDRFDHPAGVGFSYVWSMPLRIHTRTMTGQRVATPPPNQPADFRDISE